MHWCKSEVEQLIVAGLSPAVTPAGFRYAKTDKSFKRVIDGGWQKLGVALWDYNPLFAFSLNMTVRLDSVQRIVNQFSGSPPQYHGFTVTSLTQLEFLGLPAEQGHVEFRASSEVELASLLPGVAVLVTERVIPFFDKYRDLASLNCGLNPNRVELAADASWLTDRRSFDASNQPYRAMAGVTVAWLAGDLRWLELVTAYRAHLRQAHNNDLQKFEGLVGSLAQAPT